MHQPSVCAVMLTACRPSMAKRAVEAFRRQTYEHCYIFTLDAGEETAHVGQSVGKLRNIANREAVASCRSDVLIHWDDDDLSHPNRIAEQVELLQVSGADVVGYNQCLFWDTRAISICCGDREFIRKPEAYLYRNPNSGYAIGSSLCYWRRCWESKPFPDLTVGEDAAWISGQRVCGVSALPDGEPRLICSIHEGNTSPAYAALTAAPQCDQVRDQFARVPEWDLHCAGRMAM